MLAILVAFLGGVLTIASPCILPVLPFVFARGGSSFRSHHLPLLASMAVAFAVFGSLAAIGAAWVVALDESARYAAMILLGVFGLALLVPAVGERLSRPLVALGTKLAASGAGGRASSFLAPVALGVGTSLLWTPCAGPILGLLLAGAALNGANLQTSLLLLVFATGAAAAMGGVLWIGRGMTTVLGRLLPATEGLRRIAGAAVLAGVAVPAAGLDVGWLVRIRSPGTARFEEGLVGRLQAQPKSTAAHGPFAGLAGTTEWINSPALRPEDLDGKVVLLNFWTYSCINCLRTLPYLRAWDEKYRNAGLVVIGVHTPEFAFEKRAANVRQAVSDLRLRYPVAMDNDFRIWRSFQNNSWPAFHIVDSRGQVRHRVAGEHAYGRTEEVIRDLLTESGRAPAAGGVRPQARGSELPPDLPSLRSGESYLGYGRATGFAPGGRFGKDRDTQFTPVRDLRANNWTLAGRWRLEAERVVGVAAQGRVLHRFHARDLHMVLGPSPNGQPIRFRVLLDGKPPLADHGSDTDANGDGLVDRERLYQLVRQAGPVKERLFEIEFLDAGVEAYAFTFG